MIDPCGNCSSERVAAVLDKRIEASPRPGNKYRRKCLNCGYWLNMCSAGDFQTAEHQHVLPRDADPEGDDPTVPVEEFEGEVDGLQSADGDAPEAVTDGGEDVNTFPCPGCGERVEGYPDECPHDCGTVYDWSNVDVEN